MVDVDLFHLPPEELTEPLITKIVAIGLEKIAEGVSDYGDFKAILYKTSDGRHFIRFIPLSDLEKPHIEWLPGNDYLEWLRRLAYNQHC